MPRIPGIPGPYRFYFYSFDCDEPLHVHVRRDRQHCKFWLAPVTLAWNHGFGRSSSRRGMSTAATVDTRIKDVVVTDETITARLVDGRAISVPLAWSWRLAAATPAQRANWELIGDGHGVHWPDIDEDLSADGLLHGVPARRPHRRPPPSRARDTNRRRTSSR